MKKSKKENKKRIILFELCIELLILVCCIPYHYIKLKMESPLRTQIGQLVEVDGNNISVYTEGEGDKTLVFLSGSETTSPILDFKSLYSLLSDEYTIVVVERFGYGFSDVVDNSRDIETVLHETRTALAAANIDGPYILCAHSLSGIESLYWAQQYSEEVEAIIGLDMAVPEILENFNDNKFQDKLIQILAKCGAIRLVPLFSDLDCVKKRHSYK